jgi:hypothetical protein
MNELLLSVANTLTAAELLLEQYLKNAPPAGPSIARHVLFSVQLSHLVEQSRELAGLNPNGTFEPVPLKRAGPGHGVRPAAARPNRKTKRPSKGGGG